MLKRSGFKQSAVYGGKGTAKRLTAPKKGISKGYQIPQWFRSIPLGSHGNSPTQKRYWKVISDFVRQRDFEKYKGRCVSCDHRFESYKEAQGGHFLPWGACNSYFKFDISNVHAQCSTCNYELKKSHAEVGHAFGEELKRRYGEKHLDWIEKENNKWRGVKLEDHIMVERVEKLLEENPWFVLP